jgi:DNA polymerase
MIFWADFETASECDLPEAGVYNYARHPSTRVLCMSYAFNNGPVMTWRPGEPMPDVRGQIRAHNAAFERLIFWHVLGMKIPLEQFYCTAAQARANCAPGSLEDVGRFAGLSMRKDHRGAYLVRKCCMPPFNTELLPELIEYCEQDVRTMRAASQAMRELTPEELEDYHVNERINDRGVLVDIALCGAAVKYAADELREIQDTVVEITGGEITSVRSPRMRLWVQERLGPEALKLMQREDKMSIDKNVRANLLAMDNPEEVPPDVREVIQCADDLWASSVAKFDRLRSLACADGRVRGAFVFAGGSATGRASSYGAQLHNAPRKCAKDPAAVRHAMVRGHAIVPTYGSRVTDVLKGMLRPAIVPAKGNVFVGFDWNAIEGRVNPWLADSVSGEAKLQCFRDGLDPYIVNAAATFNRSYADIEREYKETDKSDDRQLGKIQELALSFAGGAGAFNSMARVYGVRLSDTEVKRAVNGWRRANPWAVAFWSALEVAYIRALRNPGKEFSAGRIVYLSDGRHLWYSLPSGRVLCYPYARFEEDGSITYAKAAWKPAAGANEWPRARLWKGIAVENCTQATAHDLLREALRKLPDVVAHIHDEILIECPKDRADEVLSNMKTVMTTPPSWASGLPLAVSGKVMLRFGK